MVTQRRRTPLVVWHSVSSRGQDGFVSSEFLPPSSSARRDRTSSLAISRTPPAATPSHAIRRGQRDLRLAEEALTALRSPPTAAAAAPAWRRSFLSWMASRAFCPLARRYVARVASAARRAAVRTSLSLRSCCARGATAAIRSFTGVPQIAGTRGPFWTQNPSVYGRCGSPTCENL